MNGNRIAELKALGMSVNDIAAGLGIDRSTVDRRIAKEG